jgi:hypothetical protein
VLEISPCHTKPHYRGGQKLCSMGEIEKHGITTLLQHDTQQ